MSEVLIAQLQKQNRLLKQIIIVGSSIAVATMLMAAKSDKDRQRFSEIDVERINIVMPDGKKEMVIANRLRIPEPITDGKEVKRGGAPAPGMIFYNDSGDENGGFLFAGKLDEKGKPSAALHFSMDRFGGDQQLALGHYEANSVMETGLTIFDRGLHKDYGALYDAYEKTAEGPEKDKLLKQWKEAGGRQTERVFVGKTRGKSSAVILNDTKGHPRIMMLVTPEGEARIDFYDQNGNVIQSLPEKSAAK